MLPCLAIVGLSILLGAGAMALDLCKAGIAFTKAQIGEITVDALLIEVGDVGGVVKPRIGGQFGGFEKSRVAYEVKTLLHLADQGG